MTAVSVLDLVPIPQLGPANPLDGTELVVVEQTGVTRRTTTGALGGGFITSKLAVALAAGGTNDWAPAIAGVTRLEVTAAGVATVTGLAGGTDGKVIIVTNVGGNDFTLMAQDPGSVAANRFASNGDTLLQAGWSAQFIYSAALSRWTRLS
jgi:hypothetical protein